MELDLMFLKKTPPHSPEAEKTVLGGILIDNKNLNVILSILSIEDFWNCFFLRPCRLGEPSFLN